MTLAHLSTPLLGLVDTAVIGRLGEAHLLGAIAIGAVIFDFLFWGFGFLRMGTAGLTAQALGAGHGGEQRAILARALLLAAGLGLLLVLLQVPTAYLAFRLLGPSQAVEAAARDYFAVRIWAAPFALANYALLGWFIGLGKAGTGLALQVFLNVCNMALNVWFVMGLELGVVGSALGTLVAEAVTVAAGLGLAGRSLGWRAGVGWSRILDKAQLLRMASVNRDIMIRTLALIGAFGFFMAQGARAGDITLAANAVLYNLFLFAGFFLDGFATAAEQLGGRAVGARDGPGFRRSVHLSIGWGYGLAALLSLTFWAAGPSIIDLLTTSAEVREGARAHVAWAALTPLAGVLAFGFDGVYIGATWTAAMRNMMVLSLCAYLAAWSMLAPLFGNHGLWAAFNAFLLARGLLLLWRYPAEFRRTFPETRVA